jgi:hypothetical protein
LALGPEKVGGIRVRMRAICIIHTNIYIYIYVDTIHGPGDTCSLSLLSLIAMLSYRIVSSVPKIGI